jgi:glycosyltransferase involved in cell wall biosynthesis
VARGDRRQADPAVSARHSGLAFDARYITAEPSGMGQMALELLRGLVELDTPLEMTVLVNARTQLPGDLWEREELTFVPAAWDPRGPANQVFLPRVLKRARVHALHSIDCFAPILTRRVALITNLHDLIPLVYADERMRGWKVRLRPFWKCWLKLQCRRAERIVTVSSHSAADLARLLHVDARKVRVIHNPVRDWPRPEPVARFRQRLGLPGRVISYVGRQEPYKNVVALVRAMRIVLDTAADERLRLVVAGAPDPRYPEASQEVERLGLADRVLFTGYLGEDSLGALYRTSDVFVFPSLYEGFGLPPVEAMRFGTPVVVGRRTAAPEVLGDAAYYVDPEDPRAIAGGILEILRDPALAGRLRQAGKRQAARYSAHRAARQYRHLYDEVLGTV